MLSFKSMHYAINLWAYFLSLLLIQCNLATPYAIRHLDSGNSLSLVGCLYLTHCQLHSKEHISMKSYLKCKFPLEKMHLKMMFAQYRCFCFNVLTHQYSVWYACKDMSHKGYTSETGFADTIASFIPNKDRIIQHRISHDKSFNGYFGTNIHWYFNFN